jgi:hypothetical protein
MSAKLGGGSAVKRLNASALVLGLSLLLTGFLVPAVHAQITPHEVAGHPIPRGIPPSVTSLDFGGRRVNGLPPSVTSLGFPGRTRFAEPPNAEHRHRHRDQPLIPWGGAVYGLPYYPYDSYDDTAQAPPDDATDPGYQGGATMFDRRGPGTSRAPEPTDSNDSTQAKSVTQPPPQPVSNQPDTVLVFKDGHQLEVANYAIVGTTLFDLTEGHRRKIPLSELDLIATGKENDDRGVDFQVPLGTVAN